MSTKANRVHVSLGELRTAAGRALAGLGAPAGTERDGARAVVWLESRNLRGAAALVSDLHDAATAGLRQPDIAGRRLDLSDCPVLVWGSSLVELAMLEAGTAIVLEGCRTPRALVPEAAAQADRGWRFRIQAAASEALVASGAINLDRSLADLEAVDVRLVAEPVRSPGIESPPEFSSSHLTTAELDSRHAASLATGLRLDPDDWRAIREAAARIFVPASKRSRSRGAGAEVDDNE